MKAEPPQSSIIAGIVPEFPIGLCMHSAYKLGYTKGYHLGKLIAFLEELDRKENK